MGLQITSAFDGGNIVCLEAEKPEAIRLEIRKDHLSDFYQWFYFRLSGAAGEACKLVIENAAGAAYPLGWEKYQAVASYDLNTWQRIATAYDGQALTLSMTPSRNSVYIAYFAPYSTQRHAELVARAANMTDADVSVLGQTLDGRDLDLIRIGTPDKKKHTLWITARQHPGETMAEWWMEGFLERLADRSDSSVQKLLEQSVLYIVPNMNPDGSARGHLRTNAAGVNLNREWQAPSLEKSPEVYLVLEKMHHTGVDFALDVHGDEALPYNFIAGTEGIPSWTDQLGYLLSTFKQSYVVASGGAFQTKHGYPVNQPGKANLKICSNALAEAFGCLAMTLEMPFKDDANTPHPRYGWSPERSVQLGRDVLEAMLSVLPNLRD